MIEAYILVEPQVGRADEVARQVRMLPFARSFDVVGGPFDVISRFVAGNAEELRARIRLVAGIPGVTRTVSCLLGPPSPLPEEADPAVAVTAVPA